jgi:N-acetylglucosaminyldiphosphoundecaprenol N-acetyl-beta-D-mannosaminyltransferase
MNNQVEILGNRIDCFSDYQQLYTRIVRDRKERAVTGYVTINNVHTMMEGYWNSSYQQIINSSYLSIPDGKPLQVVGRLKGNKEIARLFGPTVMEHFIDWGRKDNVSHFFFGSSEASLQKLKTAIEDKYPGTRIAGMISPPFRPFDQWDNDKYAEIINKAQADFIWVGLGAPKQERWMSNQYKKINSGVLFGVGAGFDYLAGNTKHAPAWMKNFALEWLYRLVQEPKRLWKRYFTTIPPFIVLALLEVAGVKVKKPAATLPPV